MRHVFLFALLLSMLKAEAAGLSEMMNIFREGAVLLTQGIERKDPSLLTDASEFLFTADPDEADDIEIIESAPGALSAPTILFTASFCDKARVEDYVLVPLDPLAVLRATNGGVTTITRSIAPGASASFKLKGDNELNAVVVSPDYANLSCTVNFEGGCLESEPDESGYSGSFVWTQPASTEDFSVNISNNGTETAVFVIALK